MCACGTFVFFSRAITAKCLDVHKMHTIALSFREKYAHIPAAVNASKAFVKTLSALSVKLDTEMTWMLDTLVATNAMKLARALEDEVKARVPVDATEAARPEQQWWRQRAGCRR